MGVNMSEQKKTRYVEPELKELDLLKDTAKGWSEPPPPGTDNTSSDEVPFDWVD